MAMPTENPQLYGQRMIDDPQNWLFANRLRKAKSLPAWISRFVNLKKPGYCATLMHLHGIYLDLRIKPKHVILCCKF